VTLAAQALSLDCILGGRGSRRALFLRRNISAGASTSRLRDRAGKFHVTASPLIPNLLPTNSDWSGPSGEPFLSEFAGRRELILYRCLSRPLTTGHRETKKR
jgi:hypothetical protein